MLVIRKLKLIVRKFSN